MLTKIAAFDPETVSLLAAVLDQAIAALPPDGRSQERKVPLVPGVEQKSWLSRQCRRSEAHAPVSHLLPSRGWTLSGVQRIECA
jgi:hypothetical protein